jgi:hypothetical protein
VFVLEKDLYDVISLKGLLRKFLVMWDEVLIELVAQILDVFEHNGARLIVDTAE